MKYKGQTIRVNLGNDKYTGNPAIARIMKFGAGFALALARRGKTTIAKNIITQCNLAGRRVIIIDPMGDYSSIKRINFDSKNWGCVPNIVTLSNFTFPISKFNVGHFRLIKHSGMWEITDYACAMLGRLAHNTAIHHDDPNIFREILRDLPESKAGETNEEQLNTFNERYSTNMPEGFVKSMKTAMINSFDVICEMGIVWNPQIPDQMVLNEDSVIPEIVSKHNVIFDMKMRNEGKNPVKAQIYTSIILSELGRIFEKIKALLVIDELDMVCPAAYNSPSTDAVLNILNKEMRSDIHILMITQNDSLVNPWVMESYWYVIVGQMNENSSFHHYVRNLKWDYDRNIREFMLIDENRNVMTFEPAMPPCE